MGCIDEYGLDMEFTVLLDDKSIEYVKKHSIKDQENETIEKVDLYIKKDIRTLTLTFNYNELEQGIIKISAMNIKNKEIIIKKLTSVLNAMYYFENYDLSIIDNHFGKVYFEIVY